MDEGYPTVLSSEGLSLHHELYLKTAGMLHPSRKQIHEQNPLSFSAFVSLSVNKYMKH